MCRHISECNLSCVNTTEWVNLKRRGKNYSGAESRAIYHLERDAADELQASDFVKNYDMSSVSYVHLCLFNLMTAAVRECECATPVRLLTDWSSTCRCLLCQRSGAAYVHALFNYPPIYTYELKKCCSMRSIPTEEVNVYLLSITLNIPVMRYA